LRTYGTLKPLIAHRTLQAAGTLNARGSGGTGRADGTDGTRGSGWPDVASWTDHVSNVCPLATVPYVKLAGRRSREPSCRVDVHQVSISDNSRRMIANQTTDVRVMPRDRHALAVPALSAWRTGWTGCARRTGRSGGTLLTCGTLDAGFSLRAFRPCGTLITLWTLNARLSLGALRPLYSLYALLTGISLRPLDIARAYPVGAIPNVDERADHKRVSERARRVSALELLVSIKRSLYADAGSVRAFGSGWSS
jgi:hypothetical protein